MHGLHKRSIARGGKVDGVDCQPLFDVLSSHGLTLRATRGITGTERGKEREKAKRALLPLIKDLPGFVADYQKALQRVLCQDTKALKIEVRLTEVKTTANRAKGTIVAVVDGKQLKESMDFVKSATGWKIVPPAVETEDSDDPDRNNDD
jgi:hypothetical protein